MIFFRKNDTRIVKCDGCKCFLDKKDAQEVKVAYDCWADWSHANYYCRACRKKYDYRRIGDYGERFYKHVIVEVNENGSPIKRMMENKPSEKKAKPATAKIKTKKGL